MDADFDAAVLGQALPPALESALAEAGAQRSEPVRAMAALMRAQSLAHGKNPWRGLPLQEMPTIQRERLLDGCGVSVIDIQCHALEGHVIKRYQCWIKGEMPLETVVGVIP